MGDGVNVAARLEGINKTFGTTICISDSILAAVEADVVARPLRSVQVKGRKQAFMIYELMGMRNRDDPELAVAEDADKLCEMTRLASQYFERGEFGQAARCYQEILRAFPCDPIAKSMLGMCAAPS